MASRPDLPSLRTSAIRMAFRLGAIVLMVWGVLALVDWVEVRAERLPQEMGEHLMLGFVITLLLAYALLIAMPFVPGIEIGISLLMMKGAEVAPFVYLATVAGLMLAFTAGRFLSYDWLHALLADLRLRRGAALVAELRPLTRAERLDRLRAGLPPWARHLAGGWRYAMLAAVLNLPGNGLLGGGGGICLAAGVSRLFGAPATFAAIAIGVAPVPLAVWLFGYEAVPFAH